jgi:hypothetical protein
MLSLEGQNDQAALVFRNSSGNTKTPGVVQAVNDFSSQSSRLSDAGRCAHPISTADATQSYIPWNQRLEPICPLFDCRIGGRTSQSAEMAENMTRHTDWQLGDRWPEPKSNRHRNDTRDRIESDCQRSKNRQGIRKGNKGIAST